MSAGANSLPTQGRLAGIDYGVRRIGISICDPQRILASPYENYTRRNERLDAEHFRKFVAAENVVGFVVGLPVYASGDESEKSREARQFGRWLHELTGLPVVFFDERYTTRQAEALLQGVRLTREKRKQRRDMLAAQIILSAFLESPHAALEANVPLDDAPERGSG